MVKTGIYIFILGLIIMRLTDMACNKSNRQKYGKIKPYAIIGLAGFEFTLFALIILYGSLLTWR